MADKYQAGESYADGDIHATGIMGDLKAIGWKGATKDLDTLLEVLKLKGEPIDDKQMIMEKLIAIIGSLPRTSKMRTRVTNELVDSCWDSLQHPPLSYLGDKYQYRTPDGSYNNMLYPWLGQAGTPYAKSVRQGKKLQGVKPDPGLLFDLLLSRDKGNFKENPAGLSAVLFYHATIIIHDIFRTNRQDSNISDTSSYLDLAPLYGSSLEDQVKVRTMERGLLKPDTFHEKRLLGQPPGVNVILVLYSRFHNYVADVLLKINEGGRFTLRPHDEQNEEEKKAAILKQDNDLFQTARLVVNGLYINISLHDYLRGITNTHHSDSDWTLDPRVQIDKQFDGEGVPRGVGNQVSAEFNLLYRFHPAISARDEKWTEDFFQTIFPNRNQPLSGLTPVELWQGMGKFEAMTPKDPSQREFGGIKRGPDGKFNDADLVKILKESMEDPAGKFGARQTPSALRVIEVMGILQARKWQVASLNEFREYFGLKRHETMEDINPDPEIADLLRKLYNHPDMVELYPGLFVEDTKPRMDPGSMCVPYTLGRAVLSDAVTLVRSDRFLTIDYTPATLTNWGYTEVQQDYKTLGGSMFYKLIQRALPGWFPYNSLHIMQPMYTRKMNEQIAKEIGTIKMYTQVDPAPPREAIFVTKNETARKILKDQSAFKVPFAQGINQLFPGERDFSDYMLAGDSTEHTAQRNLFGGIMYGSKDFRDIVTKFLDEFSQECLEKETLVMGKVLNQIDFIRDIAIPVTAKLKADLFSLDLKSDENPDGTMSLTELYKLLLDVCTFTFFNFDPALSWNRRRMARDAATKLINSTNTVVNDIAQDNKKANVFHSLSQMIGSANTRRQAYKPGSLRSYGRNIVLKLLAAGKTVQQVSDILWISALGGIGEAITMLAEVLQFFLAPGNQALWTRVQELSFANSPESDKTVREYVLEAQRLVSKARTARVCAQKITVDGQTFQPGDAVFLLLGDACRDPSTISDPLEFRPGRPVEAYMHFSYGPHECLGREIAVTYVTCLIKLAAMLKNLRPAPGEMGELKSIVVDSGRLYLSDSWSHLTSDPTTWKLHFEGRGKGVYTGNPTKSFTTQHDLDLALYQLRRTIAQAQAHQSQSQPQHREASSSMATQDSTKSLVTVTATKKYGHD